MLQIEHHPPHILLVKGYMGRMMCVQPPLRPVVSAVCVACGVIVPAACRIECLLRRLP